MKRILFSTLALAAVVVGCSKSDVVDAPNIDTPISFEAYSGRVPVSKATSIESTQDLSDEGGFVVYAFETNGTTADYTKVYIQDTLTRGTVTTENTEPDWVFSSEAEYYWPADGNPLEFVAYSVNGTYPDDDSKTDMIEYTAPTDATTAPTLTITIPDEMSDQRDIMVAEKEITKAADNASAVTLNFRHVLSRVYFGLTNEDAIDIHSVTIKGNFYKKGDVDLTAETPAVSVEGIEENSVASYTVIETADGDEPKSYEESDNVVYLTESVVEGDHYLMIIPADPTSIEIVYSYPDDVTNSIYTATANLETYTISGEEDEQDTTVENLVFAAGKSYKFLLDLSRDKITLSASMTGWDMSEEESTSAREFVITKTGTITE